MTVEKSEKSENSEKFEYSFPDEVNNEREVATSASAPYEIEIEDDTPPEDRGRKPIRQKDVKKVEEEVADDQIEDLDPRAIAKIKATNKLWHDARRDKDRIEREQRETLRLARLTLDENERLKKTLSSGAQEYAESIKNEANLGISVAEKELFDAYQLGEAEKIVASQKKLNDAQMRAARAQSFNPQQVLAQHENAYPAVDNRGQPVVQQQQGQQEPSHPRTQQWLNENSWYGENRAMTALALAEHEELISQYGPHYAGTDEYFTKIDRSMRRRFPEEFVPEAADDAQPSGNKRRVPKATSAVAPVTRNTGPRKIKITASQASIIKKLGITPERYVEEFLKLESESAN